MMVFISLLECYVKCVYLIFLIVQLCNCLNVFIEIMKLNSSFTCLGKEMNDCFLNSVDDSSDRNNYKHLF